MPNGGGGKDDSQEQNTSLLLQLFIQKKGLKTIKKYLEKIT